MQTTSRRLHDLGAVPVCVARVPPPPSVSPFGVTTGDLSGATSVIISDPLPVDLYVYRGDSGRFRSPSPTPTADPLDISAATWDCDIRSTHDASTVVVSLTVNPIDISTVEVVLDAARLVAARRQLGVGLGDDPQRRGANPARRHRPCPQGRVTA